MYRGQGSAVQAWEGGGGGKGRGREAVGECQREEPSLVLCTMRLGALHGRQHAVSPPAAVLAQLAAAGVHNDAFYI